MASGQFTPTYEYVLTITDNLKAPHKVTVAFLKLNEHTLGVEVLASQADVGKFNQIACGRIIIDKDGINTIDQGLINPMIICWNNGADRSYEELEFTFESGCVIPSINWHE